MKKLFKSNSRTQKLIIISVVLTTMVANLNGATYYVNASTGNNSNNGTSSGSPFLTIQKGINTATAGDKLVIASGTYNNTVIITKNITLDINNSNITIKSLVLNKASVKATITSSTTAGTLLITDSFELTNGLVIISGTTPPTLKTKTGLKLVGGNKNSYVDGGFWIGQTSNNAMTWPVGTGTDYRPIVATSFTKSGATEEFYFAKVSSGSPSFTQSLPATTRNISTIHHYYMNTTASSTVAYNYIIKFSYDSTSNDDYVFDYANLQLLTTTGSASWSLNNSSGTANRLGTISSISINNLQGYYILGNKLGSQLSAYLGGLNTLGSDEVFAGFTVVNGCEGDTIKFHSTSTSIGSSISSYIWDFGDGSPTQTGANVWHIYIRSVPTPLIYNYVVKLKVENAVNIDYGYKAVNIANSPRVLYNTNIFTQNVESLPKIITSVCQGQTTRITDTYNPPSGEVMQKKVWVISPTSPAFVKGNGATVGYKDSTKITYKFPSTGTYKIYITRINQYGCVAHDSQDYFHHPKPSVTIDAIDQCWDANKAIAITNTSADPTPDKMLKWYWDFGDGTKLSGQTGPPIINKLVYHKYTASGAKLLKLFVTTDADCKDSIYKTLYVYSKPNAQFLLKQFCDTTRSFNQSSVNSPEFIYNNIWNWGDGSKPDTSVSSQHIYLKPGLYNILLTTQTMNNCIDTQSLWQSINFKKYLVVQPHNQNLPINDTAMFFVTSSDINSKYRWQSDAGFGFQNLTNVGQYMGVNNDTLTVAPLAKSNNNQTFRCIVSTGSCVDTSKSAVLTISNSTNIYYVSESLTFSPNPARTFLSISTESKFIGFSYDLINSTGKLIYNGKITAKQININIENLPSGSYFIKTNFGTYKFIKE